MAAEYLSALRAWGLLKTQYREYGQGEQTWGG